MPKCTVCHHPDRYAIDRALLAGTNKPTLESLSRRYGPSPSALYRHRLHLRENIADTRQRLKNHLSLALLFKLNNFLDRIEKASQKAEAGENVDQIVKTARVGARLINDLRKMDVSWDADTVYRLMASPQWTAADVLLPTGPDFLTAGRRTMAEAFFKPCLDLPDHQDEPGDGPTGDAPPASGEQIPASISPLAAHPALTPEIIAALHPDLQESLADLLSGPPNPAPPAQIPVSSQTGLHPLDEPPTAAASPPGQREISAKKAPKPRSKKQNKQLNQSDKTSQESCAKKPLMASLVDSPRAAAGAPRPVPSGPGVPPGTHNSPRQTPPRESPDASAAAPDDAPKPVSPCPPAVSAAPPHLTDSPPQTPDHCPTDPNPPTPEPGPDAPRSSQPVPLCSRAASPLPPQTTDPAAPSNLAADSPLTPDHCQAAALASGGPSLSCDRAQAPPPETLCLPEENAAPPQTTAHCPLPTAHCIKDRFAGYFKFPGDYPPGYLFAMTHGYWPDDPPARIPDRRWQEDFGGASRFGKTKGAY